MKKHIGIYILFFVSAIISCNYNTDEDETEWDVSLSGQKLEIDEVDIYKYPRILVNDIFISGNNDFYGSKIEKLSCQKSELLFHFGKGHNEFQIMAFAKGCDNSLMLLNFVGDKLLSLTVIGTDSVGSMKDNTKWKKYDFSKLPPIRFSSLYFSSMSDSTILIGGAPYDALGHILSIIDFKNQKVYPLEYWPKDEVKCDSMIKMAVYTDNSRVFANGKGHYLYQCNNERFAFVFSIEGNKVKVIKELFSVYTDYAVDKSGINYKYNSLSTKALECTANNSNIYALLRDSNRKGEKLKKWKNPYIFGNIVQIYDWDGNKVKTICLDKYGQDLLVSEDNKTLYLLNLDYFEGDSEPEIWVYDISGLNL